MSRYGSKKTRFSGIFADVTEEYGVTLVVGRGYNSWSAYKEAAERFLSISKPSVILYFGDFDPSGEDIVRALKDGLAFFGTYPEIEKMALTLEDVEEYDLPPDFTKKTDREVAEAVGVHRCTVTSWKLYNPYFQEELNRRRCSKCSRPLPTLKRKMF